VCRQADDTGNIHLLYHVLDQRPERTETTTKLITLRAPTCSGLPVSFSMEQMSSVKQDSYLSTSLYRMPIARIVRRSVRRYLMPKRPRGDDRSRASTWCHHRRGSSYSVPRRYPRKDADSGEPLQAEQRDTKVTVGTGSPSYSSSIDTVSGSAGDAVKSMHGWEEE
jgi:hypothetical protein